MAAQTTPSSVDSKVSLRRAAGEFAERVDGFMQLAIAIGAEDTPTLMDFLAECEEFSVALKRFAAGGGE